MTALYHWRVEFLLEDIDSPIPPCKLGKPLFVVAQSLIEVLEAVPKAIEGAKIKVEVIGIQREHQITMAWPKP